MSEPTQEDLAPSSDLSRRTMLQRSAFVVGAAAVWSTPIVQTLGQRPAAATGTPPPLAEFSVLAAEVTVNGERFIIKFSGSSEEWETGAIGNCPGWDAADRKGDEEGFVVKPHPTDEDKVLLCYEGVGSVTWHRTTFKEGPGCEDDNNPSPDGDGCITFEV